MGTFPNERNKISLAPSEQQRNVPSDRKQLLGTWESERLDGVQQKCSQSDRELVLGAQQHLRTRVFQEGGRPRRAQRAGLGVLETELGWNVRLFPGQADKGGGMSPDGAAGGAACACFLNQRGKTCPTLSE